MSNKKFAEYVRAFTDLTDPEHAELENALRVVARTLFWESVAMWREDAESLIDQSGLVWDEKELEDYVESSICDHDSFEWVRDDMQELLPVLLKQVLKEKLILELQAKRKRSK